MRRSLFRSSQAARKNQAKLGTGKTSPELISDMVIMILIVCGSGFLVSYLREAQKAVVPLDDVEEELVNNLRQWLTANGAQIRNVGVGNIPVKTADGSNIYVRRLVADEDFGEGEVVFEIPANLMPSPAQVGLKNLQTLHGLTLLQAGIVFYMMELRRVRHEAPSFWSPYAALLLDTVDHELASLPTNWPPEQLAASSVAQRRVNLLTMTQRYREFAALRAVTAGNATLRVSEELANYSFEEYMEAADLIASRSLAPGVVIPFVDMLLHDAEPNLQAVVHPDLDSEEVRLTKDVTATSVPGIARRPISEGTALSISYFDRSNLEGDVPVCKEWQVQRYGFSDPTARPCSGDHEVPSDEDIAQVSEGYLDAHLVSRIVEASAYGYALGPEMLGIESER